MSNKEYGRTEDGETLKISFPLAVETEHKEDLDPHKPLVQVIQELVIKLEVFHNTPFLINKGTKLIGTGEKPYSRNY